MNKLFESKDKTINSILYFCTLLEYIRRSRKISMKNIIEHLSKDDIENELNESEINHCDSFDESAYNFCDKYNINQKDIGDYDYSPSFLEIGYVYKNLIIDVANESNESIADVIIKVLSSFIIDEISNYESDTYCSSSDYLLKSYYSGHLLSDD